MELAVEVELVLVRRAGWNEDPVPGVLGGDDLVCKLRVVGIDLGDLEEDHLITRLGEGVDARVERLDHLVVVVLRPAQTLHGVEGGLRIHHRLLRRQLLILEPAPQLVDVDVGIDGTALGSDRHAGEVVGVGRDVGERGLHEALELGNRGADVGQALHVAGHLRLLGHRSQSGVDVPGAEAAETVAANRCGRAAEPLEQLDRLRIELAEVFARVDVAAQVQIPPVEMVPIGERVVGTPEVVPFVPGRGEIERRGLLAPGPRGGRARAG